MFHKYCVRGLRSVDPLPWLSEVCCLPFPEPKKLHWWTIGTTRSQRCRQLNVHNIRRKGKSTFHPNSITFNIVTTKFWLLVLLCGGRDWLGDPWGVDHDVTSSFTVHTEQSTAWSTTNGPQLFDSSWLDYRVEIAWIFKMLLTLKLCVLGIPKNLKRRPYGWHIYTIYIYNGDIECFICSSLYNLLSGVILKLSGSGTRAG